MLDEKLLERLKPSLLGMHIACEEFDDTKMTTAPHTGEEQSRSSNARYYEDYEVSLQYQDLSADFRGADENQSQAQGYQERLSLLESLKALVLQHPYDVALRLALSEQYAALGYPDLAAGEAYLALLLVDEICDDSGEYHELAFEALQVGLTYQPALARSSRGKGSENAMSLVSEEEVLAWASTAFSEAAYDRLVSNLLSCGCLRSATEMCVRATKKHPSKLHHEIALRTLRTFCDWCDEENEPINLIKAVENAPDTGRVRRQLYPWNDHEPDRFSRDALSVLNGWMADAAPRLEVRATELPMLVNGSRMDHTVKQLGVFAKEDLAAGQMVLDELSLLTASSRLNDMFCDACSGRLKVASTTEDSTMVACEECQETVFCSQRCLELAQESYHPSTCERDVSALSRGVPVKEAADALYSLLLLRTLAMSETQDVHPLDLREVKYIWGDYTPAGESDTVGCAASDAHAGHPRNLPFSFKYNILIPLNMLEKMDVNIFDNGGRYEGWVFNTLYAKFRGTASARQGLDGRPEVGAVHPLWCLANHSCDPDVTWSWDGSMQLRIKEERQRWLGKPADHRQSIGVRQGQEVLSHYCDVTLPLKERREWAAGALGGLCQCDRCRWEETHQSKT